MNAELDTEFRTGSETDFAARGNPARRLFHTQPKLGGLVANLLN
jgi:hypothetical protein